VLDGWNKRRDEWSRAAVMVKGREAAGGREASGEEEEEKKMS
jgi:hypothetical protein